MNLFNFARKYQLEDTKIESDLILLDREIFRKVR